MSETRRRPYDPVLKLTDSGVPVLSRARIEQMAGRFLSDFDRRFPEVRGGRFAPCFAEKYLGLVVEERWLSHNGSVIGATVFEDGTRVPVYVPGTRGVERVSAGRGTVFLDLSLSEDGQEHRKAFTLLHECAHHLLHGNFYRRPRGAGQEAAAACRREWVRPPREAPPQGKGAARAPAWTDGEWMEWQANCLAASLLMPRAEVEDWFIKEDVNGYVAHRVLRGMTPRRAWRISAAHMAIRFSVSQEAAELRLRELGMMPRKGEEEEL